MDKYIHTYKTYIHALIHAYTGISHHVASLLTHNEESTAKSARLQSSNQLILALQDVSLCTDAERFAHIHSHTHTHLHTHYAHTNTERYIHVYVYVCVCVRMRACACWCVVRIYLYIYMYTWCILMKMSIYMYGIHYASNMNVKNDIWHKKKVLKYLHWKSSLLTIIVFLVLAILFWPFRLSFLTIHIYVCMYMYRRA